jgi:ribosomal protein S18 acetylase RimI-like enzyme
MTASPVPLPLSPRLRGPAAEALALAFHQDPIACYVFPEEARRRRVLRWMFHCHLRYGLRYGEVYTTDGVDGVAIWLSPGQTTQTLWRVLRTGALSAPLRFGWSAFLRSVTFLEFATAWHQQCAPKAHWYLFYLGVTPAQQGRGIGSALLQPVLARADAHWLSCYLETGVARNVRFYERHGFQVVAEGALPREGPPLWAMVRAPGGT